MDVAVFIKGCQPCLNLPFKGNKNTSVSQLCKREGYVVCMQCEM